MSSLRSITSGRVLATLQVQPKPGADIAALVTRTEQALHDRFDIEHVTVGLDWAGSGGCSLATAKPALNAGHSHG